MKDKESLAILFMDRPLTVPETVQMEVIFADCSGIAWQGFHDESERLKETVDRASANKLIDSWWNQYRKENHDLHLHLFGVCPPTMRADLWEHASGHGDFTLSWYEPCRSAKPYDEHWILTGIYGLEMSDDDDDRLPTSKSTTSNFLDALFLERPAVLDQILDRLQSIDLHIRDLNDRMDRTGYYTNQRIAHIYHELCERQIGPLQHDLKLKTKPISAVRDDKVEPKT